MNKFQLIAQKREWGPGAHAFYEYLIADGLDADTARDFIDYHRERKEIWLAFEALALRAIEHGVKHWGSKGILELVRFKLSLQNRKYYSICNSMSAYYSRMFRWKYPQHKKFLREKTIRGLRAQRIEHKRAA